MSRYSAFSDDFYVNVNVGTEMDLAGDRTGVLHFFEQIRKRYASMEHFYCRDRGEYVLEENKDAGQYRWASVEPRRVGSGYVNPPTVEEALEQHRLVLDVAPYALSLSPIDCESVNVMFGFDFTYRGNHNKLVAEALGVAPALERFTERAGGTIISHEPAIQLAIDEDCRTQCRLSLETRTSAFQIRTGDYGEDQLSVYLTMRRYGSLLAGETYVSVMEELARAGLELIDQHVVDQVLRPLQQTIALK